MNIIIIHHGPLPQYSQPVSGSALRAEQLGLALSQAGHNIQWLGKGVPAPNGYQDRADLLDLLSTLKYDAVLLIQLEEAPHVEHLNVPIIVDLYAQRLLEANFSGTLEHDTLCVLRALRAGDLFLCSNRRQYWSWVSILSLAGISLDPAPIIELPLMSHPPRKPAPPKSPIVIGGGVWWPWQNPWEGIRRSVAEMDRLECGDLHWYGAPLDGDAQIPNDLLEHKRFHYFSTVGLSQFRAALSTASVAFDWMELNPERQLALSFRQLEYISAGLPVITYPDSPFADMMGEAGWCSWDLEQSLEHALCFPEECRRRSTIALELADQLKPEHVIEPLLEWLENPEKRPETPNPLGDIAEAWSSAEREYQIRQLLEQQVEQLQQELVQKETEIKEKNKAEAKLLSSIDRLSISIEQISGFKNEALTIAGHRIEATQRSADDLSKENALLRADVEKKSAELIAMDQLTKRLEHDLTNLRKELQEERQRRSIFKR
ncbi:MAG: hypothetical protein CMK59_02140 [Proteobacteria bacterium]|nr:hypothetical protein [Pseudomonadota bacterium]